MELTLRAAHKLVQKIDNHLATIEVVPMSTVNAYDVAGIGSAKDAFVAAQSDLARNLNRVIGLQSIRQTVRDEIRKINEVTISGLIASRKGKLERLGTYKRILGNVRLDGSISTASALERKVNMIVEGKQKSDRYGDTDSVTFTVIDAATKKGLEDTVGDLKRHLEGIEDQLLHANITNKITLNTDDVAVLREERLV